MKGAGLTSSDRSRGMAQAYKLGFEFQETNNLCKNFVTKFNKKEIETYLKKPVFKALYRDEHDPLSNYELWYLVIDDFDIEFVTQPSVVPASGEYRHQLISKRIASIEEATIILQKMLKESDSVTFDAWYQKLLTAKFRLKKTDIFDDIKNYTLKLDGKESSLTYQPQVTINFPLKYFIPLCFGLFLNQKEGIIGQNKYTINILTSLPNYNKLSEMKNIISFIEEMVKTDTSYLYGLTTLFASTIVGMASGGDNIKIQKNITSSKNEFSQIDAKQYTLFMSRRPFSMMWKELGFEKGSFDKIYELVRENSLFKQNRTPANFNRVSYGYHRNETLWPLYIDIEWNELFKYLGIKTPQIQFDVNKLANEGLLNGAQVLAIIEYLKNNNIKYTSEPLRNYMQKNSYKEVIASVENPKNRYIFRYDDSQNPPYWIEEEDNVDRYDYLSPPLFLPETDSMGRMKKPLDSDDASIFGSAIVEFRGIKNVGTFFSTETPEKFLVYPQKITKNASTLFTFLQNMEKKISNIFENVGNYIFRIPMEGKRENDFLQKNIRSYDDVNTYD